MKINYVQTSEDAGPEPNTPSVKQMRDSQARGNEGIGLTDQSYCDMMKDFNQGFAAPGDAPEDGTAPSSDGSGLGFLP